MSHSGSAAHALAAVSSQPLDLHLQALKWRDFPNHPRRASARYNRSPILGSTVPTVSSRWLDDHRRHDHRHTVLVQATQLNRITVFQNGLAIDDIDKPGFVSVLPIVVLGRKLLTELLVEEKRFTADASNLRRMRHTSTSSQGG